MQPPGPAPRHAAGRPARAPQRPPRRRPSRRWTSAPAAATRAPRGWPCSRVRRGVAPWATNNWRRRSVSSAAACAATPPRPKVEPAQAWPARSTAAQRCKSCAANPARCARPGAGPAQARRGHAAPARRANPTGWPAGRSGRRHRHGLGHPGSGWWPAGRWGRFGRGAPGAGSGVPAMRFADSPSISALARVAASPQPFRKQERGPDTTLLRAAGWPPLLLAAKGWGEGASRSQTIG